MDDKTHRMTTFAVVFRGYAKPKPGDVRKRVVEARHYQSVRRAVTDALAVSPTVGADARYALDGEIVIIAIPPGEPHDYDGPAVMRLLYGASA